MHTHPGMQIAWIESGVLTYHVVSGGSIPVTRDNGAALPTTELLGPGQTTELNPGDSVVEVDGVVHYGENLGPEPVVILASTLLDPSQLASVVYTPEASPVASPAA
jgi:quercetin dioxygenase-like cupin family protein